MKKLMMLAGILLLTLILPGSALAAPAEKVVFHTGNNKYLVNSTELTMDAAPFIADGRTYVPVRFLAGALGAEDEFIKWDQSTGTVSLIFQGDNNIGIGLETGSRQLVINYLDAEAVEVLESKKVLMDVTPVLRDGRIYLPARWVAEACGYKVEWDSNTQSVLVYAPAAINTPTGGVSVDTQETKSSTDRLELNLQLPVISGMANQSLQEKINREVLDKAMQTKSELEAGYDEYAASAKEYDFTAHPFHLSVAYQAHTTGSILSLVVETYQYSGGAHGNGWKDFYNLDTQNGRQLALQDLFKDNADYIALINKEINKQIADQINSGQDMYFEGDMGFQSISENHPFYIKDNHIVLCFGQYEIAPYAAGMPEFQLPIDLLYQQLNEDFLQLLN
ncbi:Anti-sigma-V factor RsiV [Sporotomaculum syntrophicum]|uniref:Anti-sigma-V factor RsiV n=1 Tax=Sporotomaculum syntrophicum TaxID=182264 RepID=A0A9D2WQZ1_9FIRM|nr:stalk domain-containing protein [Sporotomaculum syntrophicum]KAF1085505.1 Anti-sigma-V factor RsiV [Sporotomaculum syntrophicum]